MEGKQYYRALLEKYMTGNASEEEINDLFEELSRNENSKEWESLIAEITMAAAKDPAYSKARWEPLVNKILEEKEKPTVLSINSARKWWWAAASIILLVAAGAYFLLLNKPETRHEIVKTIIPHDIKPPVTNRATITLANGKTVYLDSATNGMLVTQGNVKLVKLADGQIAYQSASGVNVKELQYNTLFNPRGSKVIDMTMSDGSHVWLNAGSSVTYPVAFIGNERRITISGEAYFEVSHDVSKPFKVSKGDMEVTVLGTHFNVNAYDDETNIKVTLLEGSVKVTLRQTQGDKLQLLKPGQQAKVATDINLENDVDLEQVMAWKNGKFDFGESSDLKDIMRQAARWYDLEVEYGRDSKQDFGGGISRQVNVSKVLEKLELTGRVHFKIEGKKVIVNP